MVNKILIATTNPHKRNKLLWIIDGIFEKVEFPESLNLHLEIEESGGTFEKNAIIKAVEYSKHYDGYTIATDGGMIIPALGKSWDGLQTKRFAGENATDFERIEKLLEMMKGKKGGERKMVWKEAIAVAKAGKVLFSKEVEGAEGVLQENFDPSKYSPGIWVFSVCFFPQLKKNFFDLNETEVKEVEISWYKLKKSIRDFFLLA